MRSTTRPLGCLVLVIGLTIGVPSSLAAKRSAAKPNAAPTTTTSAPAAEAPPLPFVEGSWTLAVLPDTQSYSAKRPEVFTAQTRWIVANRDRRRIAFVVHEGDIVNANTRAQWTNARTAMSLLDGVVPYALAPGNHDFGGVDGGERESLLSVFFPVASFQGTPTFGGTLDPGRLDNSYHLFTAGGRDWLVIALESAPRNPAVEWADRVLTKYPQRSAILVTHAYMYFDNTRYDHKTRPDQKWSPYAYGATKRKGGVNDGEDLWQKVVSRHANMVFVFSGHVLGKGTGRLSSKGAHGNVVHQMLANYQMRNGGEGYLRLVEMLPDGKTVQVKTYSPFLDKYLTAPDQQFVLDLPPAPASNREPQSSVLPNVHPQLAIRPGHAHGFLGPSVYDKE